ncbi:SGNH/GDSL hydrolase family protein [Lysinibacillus sp. 1P01SD]|uniref:SGNH/GDSL hydrolase family protein n=1 Tax=Lysinibacillus sp. 1P01SD TaxID=3132285 RepID=UPI0039A3BD67
MRILIAGDSLSLPRPHRINSFSFDEKELAVGYEQTYPAIIIKDLLMTYKFNPYIELINKSKRGQTIAGVYSEFIDYLFFHEPEIIILHVGIVDCWFRDELNGKQRVPKDEFAVYLDRILSYLKFREECKLILIGIAPTSLKMESRFPKINEAIKSYNKILSSKEDYKNIFYVPLENQIDIREIQKYLLPDHQHLNVEGNRLVANELLKIIKGIVNTRQGYMIHKETNYNELKEIFYSSYKEYPKNIDTIYNLMVTAYETEDTDLLYELINFINASNIYDYELGILINEIYKQVKN